MTSKFTLPITALLCLCVLLWHGVSGCASEARLADYSHVERVPNPRTTHGGWVSDQAALLGPYAASLEARLAQLHRASGAELALVILPSIAQQDPRSFATALYERWQIGKHGRDDGALILHVVDQRRLEIETGYGLEAALPDATCSWLVHEVALPFFRGGDFARGHTALVYGVAQAITQPQVHHDSLVASSLASVTGLEPYYPSGTPAAPAAHDEPMRPHTSLLVALLCAVIAMAARAAAHLRLYRHAERRPPWPWRLGGMSLLFAGICWGSFLWNGEANLGFLAAFVLGSAAFFNSLGALWTYLEATKRSAPRHCPRCKQPLVLLGESEEDAHLEAGHQLEETLNTLDHDVWKCACGLVQVSSYRGPTPAEVCSACSYRTLLPNGRYVHSPATQDTAGVEYLYFLCRHCGHETFHERSIAPHGGGTRRDEREAWGSSDDSPASGGGSSTAGARESFGGGSTGGGGAGGSY
ncbi:MAG: TPM domain-containing protein [Myxococcales bacterium]